MQDKHGLRNEQVMPPKKVVLPKKGQARKSEQCILCTQKIADGKDQVLFCAGKCQGFVHRYCAGVSEAQFLALREQSTQQSEQLEQSKQSTPPATPVLQSSDPSTPRSMKSGELPTQQSKRSTQSTILPKPFLCLVCTQQVHNDEVSELKDTVAALKLEVLRLRDEMQKLTVTQTDHNMAMQTKSYAAATGAARVDEVRERANGGRRGGRSGRGGRGVSSNRCASGGVGSVDVVGEGRCGGNDDEVEGVVKKSTKGREMVNGARRIWGTLKSASAYAVKNTLVKLSTCSDANKLQVKRKYKTLQNGKCMWWFVIHHKEEVMQALEAEWESLKLQTGWCLERCMKPVGLSPAASSNDQSNAGASIAPSPSCQMSSSPVKEPTSQKGMPVSVSDSINNQCTAMNAPAVNLCADVHPSSDSIVTDSKYT